ncbi:MAG: helix-turn-helix domain-containing protein [Bacillota bacterium]|jgi:sugar-specific transcriptional regulator TrmB
MELIEALGKVGFTKHEAVLYLTLCKEGELTGYEAAKISGIPRSNAYLALAALVEKGGAYRIESEAVRFTAVPVNELTANLRREFEQVLSFLANVPVRQTTTNPYITITGQNQIVNKMKNLINKAMERLYLALAINELRLLETEIEQAIRRGLKVVIITDQAYKLEHATIYFHHKQPGQIRLITDSNQVLTGELSGRPDSTCLYSMNPNLVQLIKDSLINELELIKLKKQG